MATVIKSIDFDNDYPKLFGQDYGRLLAVFNDVQGTLLRNKMSDLVHYDTKRDDGRFYFIDTKKDYMILLFEGNLGILFTSIRKSNPESIAKYNDSIGDVFKLNICDACEEEARCQK